MNFLVVTITGEHMNKKLFELGHRIIQFDVDQAKYVAAAGMVVVLVLAWVLTGPIFQLSGKFFRRNRPIPLKSS